MKNNNENQNSEKTFSLVSAITYTIYPPPGTGAPLQFFSKGGQKLALIIAK